MENIKTEERNDKVIKAAEERSKAGVNRIVIKGLCCKI